MKKLSMIFGILLLAGCSGMGMQDTSGSSGTSEPHAMVGGFDAYTNYPEQPDFYD